MSKILFLVNHDLVIYNFRLELVERLLREGHRVAVSSPYGSRIDQLIQLGCRFYPLTLSRRGKNPLQDGKLLLHYKKLLKQVQPDMVFTYTIKPNIYGGLACAQAGIPYAANITGLGTAVENPGPIQTLTVALYRRALRKAQRVFFQNQENRQFFLDRGLAIGVDALLPGSGVNLQRFSPLPYPVEATVEFVFISRIMKEKGIDQYLAAAEYIREKYPHTRFHICGFCEQDYGARLQTLQAAGIIQYHGMVGDVRPLLAQTHCTVHPTCYPEGISNALLESAACARPLIATDRSGCREVIREGVNGYLVRQRSADDLIKKIEAFLELPYAQKQAMGLESRRIVQEQFDRQTVVEQYLKELKSIDPQ